MAMTTNPLPINQRASTWRPSSAPARIIAIIDETPEGDIIIPERSASYPNSDWSNDGNAIHEQYTTPKAQNMMMQDIERLRSPRTRKLIIGLAVRISCQISNASPSTNTVTSVCTRPNGSPNQSHSCPLLSMTSHADITRTNTLRPI